MFTIYSDIAFRHKSKQKFQIQILNFRFTQEDKCHPPKSLLFNTNSDKRRGGVEPPTTRTRGGGGIGVESGCHRGSSSCSNGLLFMLSTLNLKFYLMTPLHFYIAKDMGADGQGNFWKWRERYYVNIWILQICYITN